MGGGKRGVGGGRQAGLLWMEKVTFKEADISKVLVKSVPLNIIVFSQTLYCGESGVSVADW